MYALLPQSLEGGLSRWPKSESAVWGEGGGGALFRRLAAPGPQSPSPSWLSWLSWRSIAGHNPRPSVHGRPPPPPPPSPLAPCVCAAGHAYIAVHRGRGPMAPALLLLTHAAHASHILLTTTTTGTLRAYIGLAGTLRRPIATTRLVTPFFNIVCPLSLSSPHSALRSARPPPRAVPLTSPRARLHCSPRFPTVGVRSWVCPAPNAGVPASRTLSPDLNVAPPLLPTSGRNGSDNNVLLSSGNRSSSTRHH